ncbi:MAG: hypothetical protein AAB965_03940 [Patescibacteria group bacterium]
MGYLQEHRTLRRTLRSPVISAVLVIVLVSITNSTWEVYKKDKVARINKEEVEKQLADLSTKRDYLIGQLNNLSTERGIENELRSKYQVTKEGERELVVVDMATTSQDNLPVKREDNSVLENIFGLFSF